MSSSTTPTRRSKRKTSQYNHRPSTLQIQLEAAIESGGISKLISILQSTSTTTINNDIDILNTHQWTPLVTAIFKLGRNTTKNGNTIQSQEQLLQLIHICHEKGININSGARGVIRNFKVRTYGSTYKATFGSSKNWFLD